MNSGLRRSNSLSANTLAQTLPLVAGYTLNVAATPLIVQRLGLASFGVWALTGAIAQYGALLDLGTSRAVVRFISYHSSTGNVRAERGARLLAIAIIAVLWCVLLALCVPTAILLQRHLRSIDTTELSVLLVCSVTMLVATLFARAVCGFAFGHQQMVQGNIALALGNTLTVGGGIVALLWKSNLLIFAAGNAIGAIIGLLIAVVATLRVRGELHLARPTRNETREFIRFGLKGQAPSVSDLLVLQMPKIVLGITVGPAAVGIYEIGSRLAMGARALGVVTVMTLTPYFTRKYAESGLPGVSQMYNQMTPRYTTLASTPAAFLIASGYPLVFAWVGPENQSAGLVVLVLSAAFIINVSTGTMTVAANAANRPGLVAWAAITASVVSVLLTPIVAHLWEINGALLSVLIATISGAAAEFVLVGRMLDSKWTSPTMVALRPAVYLLGMASLLALAGSLIQTNSKIESAIQVLASSLCLFLLLVFAQPSARRRMRHICKLNLTAAWVKVRSYQYRPRQSNQGQKTLRESVGARHKGARNEE